MVPAKAEIDEARRIRECHGSLLLDDVEVQAGSGTSGRALGERLAAA
jgi:hypothetical protein